LENTLVAPIAEIIKKPAVTFGKVERPQNIEGRGIAHFSIRARSEIDIRDRRIVRIERVELAVESPGDFQIRPGRAGRSTTALLSVLIRTRRASALPDMPMIVALARTTAAKAARSEASEQPTAHAPMVALRNLLQASRNRIEL
jgi:hypothetical protein